MRKLVVFAANSAALFSFALTNTATNLIESERGQVRRGRAPLQRQGMSMCNMGGDKEEREEQKGKEENEKQ